MAAIVGDRVAVRTKHVDALERMGTVEAVLAESPPRYQVRWDTGEWSIITAGAARRTPGTQAAATPPSHHAEEGLTQAGTSRLHHAVEPHRPSRRIWWTLASCRCYMGRSIRSIGTGRDGGRVVCS
jgi:Domain of unknown function (DUF1918)